MRIKDIMTTEVITVSKNDTVEKCANLLSTHELSGLPVVDEEGYIEGIITEGDLIKHNSDVEVPAFLEILGGIIYLESPNKYLENVRKSMGHYVGTVMTQEVETILEDEEVEKGASIIVDRQVNRLPVVDVTGKLAGIVSRKDIMSALFQQED